MYDKKSQIRLLGDEEIRDVIMKSIPVVLARLSDP